MQEEDKKEDSVDLQHEAKELVLKQLEDSGVINYMRAKIKKSILDILDKQTDTTKEKIDFDFMTPLHRLNKNKEVLLACHLIKEFLKFYELEYTFPIFENETNVRETIKRETLLKELKLKEPKDEPKMPVLQLFVIDKLTKKDNPTNDLAGSAGFDRYGFGAFSSAYSHPKTDDDLKTDNSNKVIPNKKQLTPISFGSTNKSLDMNSGDSESNKFNTVNISDVYKRDKPAEDPKKEEDKEITSADFLKNKSKDKGKKDEEIDAVLGEGDKGKPTEDSESKGNTKTVTKTTETVTTTKINDGKVTSTTTTTTATTKIEDGNKEVNTKTTTTKNVEIENKDSSPNKYDDEFEDIIVEDIDSGGKELKTSQEKKTESQNDCSTSNVNSLGYDSSVNNNGEKNFDYVEEAEKAK